MAKINGLDTECLMKVVETVKQNWQVGKTVWKATAKWQGGFKIETESRGFSLKVDEPDMLCGTDTAANPVELVIQSYGACLCIGFVMNAAVRGIRVDDLEMELEGEIDLPGFLGLEAPSELNMDKLPGYKSVKTKIKVKADADEKTLNALFEDVKRTSPVGLTLSRSVMLETELEVLSKQEVS